MAAAVPKGATQVKVRGSRREELTPRPGQGGRELPTYGGQGSQGGATPCPRSGIMAGGATSPRPGVSGREEAVAALGSGGPRGAIIEGQGQW